MPKINISELSPAGSELFQDSESFLYELTDNETGSVGGLDRKLAEVLAKLSIVSLDLANFKSAQKTVQTIVSVRGNSINKNSVGNINTMTNK